MSSERGSFNDRPDENKLGFFEGGPDPGKEQEPERIDLGDVITEQSYYDEGDGKGGREGADPFGNSFGYIPQETNPDRDVAPGQSDDRGVAVGRLATDTSREVQVRASGEVSSQGPSKMVALKGVRQNVDAGWGERQPEKDNAQGKQEDIAAESIRAGRSLRAVVEHDPTGRTTVKASPELIPPKVITSEGIANPSSAEADDGDSGYSYWTRLVPTLKQPDDTQSGNTQPGGENQPGGLKLERFLEDGTPAGYRVEVEVKGVNAAELRGLMLEARERTLDLNNTTGATTEARKAETWLETLAKAGDTLVDNRIVIGAQDEETLRHAVGITMQSLSARGLSFRAEAVHTDKDSALLAAEMRPDKASLTPVQESLGMIQPHDKPGEGWDVKREYVFDVEQKIPPGRHIEFGSRLDNDGRPVGPFRIPTKDLLRHVFFVGTTGSGKTIAMQELLSNSLAENYRAREQDSAARPLSIVTIDMKKGGNELGGESNYAYGMAGRLANLNLPEQASTIHHIRPGDEGFRAVLDLGDPGSSTPAEQAARIIHSVLVGTSSDAESQRVLSRYITEGVERAYESLGWNMTANRPLYEDDTPPHPTMAFISQEIRAIFDDKSYDDKAKGNLSEFNAGQFEAALKLIPGQFYQGGYPIDFRKVLDHHGITAFELDKMGTNDTARKVAVVGIIQEIEKSVKAENIELGIRGPVHEPRVIIALDEASDIFDMTPAGQTTAEFLTRMRSLGIAFVIGQQGKLPELNRHALNNIDTILPFRMTSGEDREVLRDKMGYVSAEQIAFLAEEDAKEGLGLAKGPHQGGPIRVQTTRLTEEEIRGSDGGRVTDARDIVKLGHDRDSYSSEVIAGAENFLKNKNLGLHVRSWAELNAINIARNDDLVGITGNLQKVLQGMTGVDAQVRDRAITEAARLAVASRKDFGQIATGASRQEIVEHIATHMLAHVQPGAAPSTSPARREFSLTPGYFTELHKKLLDGLLPGRLPNSDKWEPVLGKIHGATAKDQEESLRWLEGKTYNRVIDSMLSIATKGAGEGSGALDTAVAELAKLTGGLPRTQAIEALRARMESGMKNGLPERQNAAFEQIVNAFNAKYPEEGDQSERLGIPSMQRELQKWFGQHKNAPPVDISEFEERYKIRIPGENRQQQYEAFLEIENRYVDESPQKVRRADLLFAPDLLEGGTTMDNIVRKFLESELPQGRIYEDLRNLYPEKDGLSLVEALRRVSRDPAAHEMWTSRLSVRVLKNPDFVMGDSTRRLIIEAFTSAKKIMIEEAKVKSEQHKRAMTELKGKD